jgi:pyruvate dehydrogenase E2 component (dihydrolipoamide acetyltransferase)
MIEFKLPSLGADMDEGTLLTWHVKPGDQVKRGQVVAVVDTTKAAVDVEIWNDGVLFELRVQPGQKVPVGTVLATLLAPGEVAGTAVAVVAEPAAPTAVAKDRQKEMRRAIAAAMSRSKREIPHYYLSEPIPMDTALAWLQKHNAGLAITERILIAVLQLKAVALALQKFPQLNGFYRDGEFHASSAVHTGVAIALRGGGLVAPALHDVQAKSLEQLMRELTDLVKRARAGSLRSSEMSDPTITVTNLGDQGVELVLGVIYPPQVALVGFGRITERPWVESGTVRAASMVTATVAADHRVSDGHQGALFLAELRELLQQPEKLAEVGKAAGGKV